MYLYLISSGTVMGAGAGFDTIQLVLGCGADALGFLRGTAVDTVQFMDRGITSIRSIAGNTAIDTVLFMATCGIGTGANHFAGYTASFTS